MLPLILTGFVSFGFRPVSVDKANVALSGYDTVAYFTDGKAVKGSPMAAVEWNGAMWRFSSLTNMRLFEANPEKYVPAFGGYCSFAISNGKAVSCDPEAFLIRDGRLYVMKNKDVLRIWSTDHEGYLSKAKAQWAKQVSGSVTAREEEPTEGKH